MLQLLLVTADLVQSTNNKGDNCETAVFGSLLKLIKLILTMFFSKLNQEAAMPKLE